jgi:hypothetical protein
MKNLQTWLLKILIAIPFFFSPGFANAQSQKIARADSLFKAKQYTQSLELYQSVFNEKQYSPAMLLKMAYIQEGLGRIGQTLYYLKLYHRVTEDEQAEKKMEELAAKFKLTGYESNDASRVQQWISKKVTLIQVCLTLILLAVFGTIYNRKKETKPWLALGLVVIIAASLLYLNNAYEVKSVIVNGDRTYLMEGPSSGASVAGILAEGNQLQVLGQTDVWLKVKWMDKTAYVKENAVLTVML